KVVARHAQLTKLMRAIEREQSIRDQLASDAASRTERIDRLHALLEVGIDDRGDTLSAEHRARLQGEVTRLADQPDRAAEETRARGARPDDSDAARPAAATFDSHTDGPSLR